MTKKVHHESVSMMSDSAMAESMKFPQGDLELTEMSLSYRSNHHFGSKESLDPSVKTGCESATFQYETFSAGEECRGEAIRNFYSQ